MIHDSERREVAARLRETGEELGSAALLWYHIAKALGVRTATDGKTACGMLADLIEPSEPKVRCVAEVKVDGERLEELAHDAAVELTGIDRNELLEEVKELEKCAYYFGLDFDEDEPLRDRLAEAAEDFAECARRIREALGVDE